MQNPQRDFIEVHKRLIINLIQATFEAGSFYLRFISNGYLKRKEEQKRNGHKGRKNPNSTLTMKHGRTHPQL